MIRVPKDATRPISDLIDVDTLPFPEKRQNWEFRVTVSGGTDMTLLPALEAVRDLFDQRIKRIESLMGRRA